MDLRIKQMWKLMASATLRALGSKLTHSRTILTCPSSSLQGCFGRHGDLPIGMGQLWTFRASHWSFAATQTLSELFQLRTLKFGCQQEMFYLTLPPSFWYFLCKSSCSYCSTKPIGNGSYTPFTGLKPPCPSHKLSSKRQRFVSEPSNSWKQTFLRNQWRPTLQTLSKTKSTCKKDLMLFMHFPFPQWLRITYFNHYNCTFIQHSVSTQVKQIISLQVFVTSPDT